jgi:hypothetical protein
MKIASAVIAGCVLGGVSFFAFRAFQPEEAGGWRLLECIFISIDGALLAGVVFGILQATLLRNASVGDNVVSVGAGWVLGLAVAYFLPALALMPLNTPRRPFPFDPLVEMVVFNVIPFITALAGALLGSITILVWRRRHHGGQA